MTACERAAALLPDHWRASLHPADTAELTAHLATCPVCAAEDETWHALGALAVREPNAAALRPGVEARPRRRWPLAVAAAAALLALGLAAGWWWRGAALRPPAPGAAAGGVAADSMASDTSAQIASLRHDVEDVETTQRAVLSLLQQTSPSTRLQGVVDSARVPAGDAAVQQALIEVLEHDPNPNVRLAAIDALARPGADSTTALVEAFHYQSSPLVQIALMDRLAGSAAAPARALLHSVSAGHGFAPEVRQRAAWALRQ